MSRDQCLSKAIHCERLALECRDSTDRGMLRMTAEHWRTLARAAKPAPRDEGGV